MYEDTSGVSSGRGHQMPVELSTMAIVGDLRNFRDKASNIRLYGDMLPLVGM